MIAAWSDLPGATQRELVQDRWSLVAGPEMLPILRRIVAEPPPPFSTDLAIARNAALQRLYELDPVAGREAILRDLQNVKAQPGLEVIKLLSKVDVAPTVRAAVERIGNHNARELDYELVDRYDDGSALGAVQTVFEQNIGKWACAPQSAMLRYFLRVAPEYGAEEVGASLRARKDTGCFRNLLQALGADLPAVQQIAIDALDDSDPELVQSAALALGRWGSADAEMALWRRLQRFHTEWADREDQLRSDPDYRSSGSRGMALEQGLVSAIAQGTSWVCAPDKLARLGGLVLTKGSTQQIEGWIEQWKQGDALISSAWSSADNPTFSMLQYQGLTADQLRSKLNQFPQGTRVLWQFRQPGQIPPPASMAQQEAFFEGMRAVAVQRGIIIGRADHP